MNSSLSSRSNKESLGLELSFVTPKANDFQWRNLYLKQFGMPTYPPPLPKNPSTTDEFYPRRSEIPPFMGDYHSTEADDDHGPDPNGAAEESRTRPDVTQSTSHGHRVTDLFDDEELFTPNLFDFLIPKKRKATVHMNDSNNESINTLVGSGPRDSFPTFDREEEENANPQGLPREILALQHNAWILLMDNRPLAWMEREVSLKGQSATGMRSRLLEIAVRPHPVSTAWRDLGEDVLDQVAPPPISEDAAASRVFESFSPYFAVISNPQTVARLREHSQASRRAQLRGHTGTVADMVGLPLFSQFATWKETYENRKAWSCAPFSYFLIYDTSFNYGHISALYVLFGLIHQHAHTHNAKCLEGRGDPIALEEASHYLAQAKTVRKLVDNRRSLCPLVATQKLTEDIILAFEQSSSRTTLTMLMQVCGFLTDCVLEPEVCARFLSREALFRQAQFVVPGMNEQKDPVEDQEEESHLNASDADRVRNSMADVFSLKRFSEKELESLFDLTYWFIDAATANCRIPIDPALLPPPPHEKERREREESRAGTDESPSSSMTLNRRQARSVSPSATHMSNSKEPINKHLVSEHLYTPGKIQVFAPVGSIVEVLILYNMRRHALHKAMLTNLATQQEKGSKRRNSIASTEKQNISVESAVTTDADRKATNLSPTTTLLATPLIIITTYIRLHGAPWLKHIFSRVFNILRRESVVLYVNRLDLEDPFGFPEESFMENSFESRDMDSLLRGSNQGGGNGGFLAHMERLEDLISQDILFVINEFLSALHGKRSATRLPQGITALITQFCSTIHLHILSSMVQLSAARRNATSSSPVAKVSEYLFTLKQKQMAAKAFRAEVISDYAMSRLIASMEQFRLTKFLLFDCWIIPALNNVTSFGFVSESSSTHLRWNIDAFARYLKILVNGPFSESDKNLRNERTYTSHPMSANTSYLPSRTSSRGKPAPMSRKPLKEMAKPPFTLTIPRYITGIYDVSSGSLVRLYSEAEPMLHTFVEPGFSNNTTSTERHTDSALPSMENTMRSKTFGTSFMSKGHRDLLYQQSQQQSFAKNLYYRAMDDANWDDMSNIMRGLNESLGLLGYDPEEEEDAYGIGYGAGVFSEESCCMRVLDAFCRRSSSESSHNVVVSEFEVLPSMAASCIDKIYEMMTGTHPMVDQAISAGVFPGKFSYSPYLACLNGILLHPKLALLALDNVMQNSKRFFHTLMSPVTDQVMLDLVGSLIQNQNDLPIVDTNSLTPLLTTLPPSTDLQLGSHAHKVDMELRKLKLQHSFLSTGCTRTTLAMKLLLNRVGPFNPYIVLDEGRSLIERDVGMQPSTFDLWWRAMALALCVKVTNVFSECSSTLSEYFQSWCQQQLDVNRKESRAVTNHFINSKGAAPVTSPAPPPSQKGSRGKSSVDEKSGFVVPKKPKKTKKGSSKRKKQASAGPKHGSFLISSEVPPNTSDVLPSPPEMT